MGPEAPTISYEAYSKALLLRGLVRYEYHYECFRGLGWQHAHEAIGVVASSRRDRCRAACRGAGSNGDLDRRHRLDGCGMHPQCAALRTHALPVHGAVLSRYDCSGARARIGCRSGRPIRMAGSRRLHHLGSKTIWWATERAGIANAAGRGSGDLSGCRKTLLARRVTIGRPGRPATRALMNQPLQYAPRAIICAAAGMGSPPSHRS
jgi:hypothetical protein